MITLVLTIPHSFGNTTKYSNSSCYSSTRTSLYLLDSNTTCQTFYQQAKCSCRSLWYVHTYYSACCWPQSFMYWQPKYFQQQQQQKVAALEMLQIMPSGFANRICRYSGHFRSFFTVKKGSSKVLLLLSGLNKKCPTYISFSSPSLIFLATGISHSIFSIRS